MESSKDPSSPSSPRRYDASRRRAQAEERQRRVLEVATELFLAQGYGATSIDEIARTADVPTKAFRKGLSRSDALDAMTFLAAAHTYTELVDGMGWTPARYEAWFADALYQLLFAD